MANSLIQVKIDKNLKDEADALFKDLGLDITTAIRMFIKQAISVRGLPFEARLKDSPKDPFYSEHNANILAKRYEKMKNGEGEIRELIDNE